MLNTVKTIVEDEKAIRKFNRKCTEIVIDELMREDLEIDEKKQIAETAKKLMIQSNEWEYSNSDFWYKYGLSDGEVNGMTQGVLALMLGFLIGTIIVKKH